MCHSTTEATSGEKSLSPCAYPTLEVSENIALTSSCFDFRSCWQAIRKRGERCFLNIQYFIVRDGYPEGVGSNMKGKGG